MSNLAEEDRNRLQTIMEGLVTIKHNIQHLPPPAIRNNILDETIQDINSALTNLMEYGIAGRLSFDLTDKGISVTKNDTDYISQMVSIIETQKYPK